MEHKAGENLFNDFSNLDFDSNNYHFANKYNELNEVLINNTQYLYYKYKDLQELKDVSTVQNEILTDLIGALKTIQHDKDGNELDIDCDLYGTKYEINVEDLIEKNKAAIVFYLDFLSKSFINRFLLTDFDLKKIYFSKYFNQTVNRLDSMLKDWEDGKTEDSIPTGYKKLDELLGGGLFPGLYTIGAISSLGKTTFCLNICDNLARSGQDIIIFSMEMDESEYMKRSMSRISYEESQNKNECLTERNIFSKNPFCTKELMLKIADKYREIAPRYEIIKGIGDTTTNKIEATVKTHIETTHKVPIVVVDFFQLLELEDTRFTDKQKCDRNVLHLKRIADKYKIPMLVISSFNRTSYTQPVSLESFKESGNIEYISENVIALQYSFMNDINLKEKDQVIKSNINSKLTYNNERAKTGNSIEIDICLLKSRKSAKGRSKINYVPMFNYFTEDRPKWDDKAPENKAPAPAEKKEAAPKTGNTKTVKEITELFTKGLKG